MTYYESPGRSYPLKSVPLVLTDKSAVNGGLEIPGGGVSMNIKSTITDTDVTRAVGTSDVDFFGVLGRFMAPLLLFMRSFLALQIVAIGVHANYYPATRAEGDVLSMAMFYALDPVTFTCALLAAVNPRSWYFVTNDMSTPATMFLTFGNQPCVPSTVYVNDTKTGSFMNMMARGAGLIFNTHGTRSKVWSWMNIILGRFSRLESSLVDANTMHTILGYYMAAVARINIVDTDGVFKYRRFGAFNFAGDVDDTMAAELAVRYGILNKMTSGSTSSARILEPDVRVLVRFIRNVEKEIVASNVTGPNSGPRPPTGFYKLFMYECACSVIANHNGIPLTPFSNILWRWPAGFKETQFRRHGHNVTFEPEGNYFEQLAQVNVILTVGGPNVVIRVNGVVVNSVLTIPARAMLSNSAATMITPRQYNPMLATAYVDAAATHSISVTIPLDEIEFYISSAITKKYPDDTTADSDRLIELKNILKKMSFA